MCARAAAASSRRRGTAGLCDSHQHAATAACAHYDAEPGDPADYLARAARRRRRGRGPRFDFRAAARESLALELQFALQCRHDARAARLTHAGVFRHVARWARELGVASLLEHERRLVGRPAARRLRAPGPTGHRAGAACATPAPAAASARRAASGIELWDGDTWPVERLDPDGRYAHQPTRRIYFADIEPEWLRALAKRWARWRLAAATQSPARCRGIHQRAAALLPTWLAADAACPADAGARSRASCWSDYLAHVRALRALGERAARRLIGDLKVLPRRRPHARLGARAARRRASIDAARCPRPRRALPRFIDEFVMGQIEAPENLARLPDLTTRTAVRDADRDRAALGRRAAAAV